MRPSTFAFHVEPAPLSELSGGDARRCATQKTLGQNQTFRALPPKTKTLDLMGSSPHPALQTSPTAPTQSFQFCTTSRDQSPFPISSRTSPICSVILLVESP